MDMVGHVEGVVGIVLEQVVPSTTRGAKADRVRAASSCGPTSEAAAAVATAMTRSLTRSRPHSSATRPHVVAAWPSG